MTTNHADRAARIAEIAEIERPKFEAWVLIERPYAEFDHRDGSYLDPMLDMQFQSWLARAALSTADAERREMVELMREAADWIEGASDLVRVGECDHEALFTKLRQAADRADGGRG